MWMTHRGLHRTEIMNRALRRRRNAVRYIGRPSSHRCPGWRSPPRRGETFSLSLAATVAHMPLLMPAIFDAHGHAFGPNMTSRPRQISAQYGPATSNYRELRSKGNDCMISNYHSYKYSQRS